jgi:hypothetical protein
MFDNHFVDNKDKDLSKVSSRILSYSLKDGSTHVLFEGTPAHPFYSRTMGKHERLANGDLLMADTLNGRVLEVTPQGDVVWEYFNHTGRENTLALVTQADRIQPSYLSAAKLKELTLKCHPA